MRETQSVHKGIHTLGSKTVLVGTERADAATSCHSSMTTVQLPTSSPRTARNTAYTHGAQALLGSTPMWKSDGYVHKGIGAQVAGRSARLNAAPSTVG